ncbi:SCO family protein [Paenibacillus sp. VCA1]|uniref:SCO family protein n=1 Tax=Paenibacillus sp. VCA1 TaxID=3039148 RepID=UPI0028723D80|nr:SCO family protein [Paenibacillus sp. VCA1]MDR9855963.1 SCO family protein [Paenibacillus sp. VCA1]
MLKRYKWTWVLLAIIVILAGYLIYAGTGIGKSKLPVLGEVEDFSFENVDGKTVTRDDTKGKVRLFYFFYTSCPDVCPVTTFLLSQTQKQLIKDGKFGKDAEFVSISFDPKVDTREKIKEFGDKFYVDYNGWYFLRGEDQKIRDVAEKSFKIAIVGDNKDNFAHSNIIALVDRDNKVRKLYNANDTDNVTAEALAKDVEELAKQ